MVLIAVIIAQSEEAEERMEEDIQESGLGNWEDIGKGRKLDKGENEASM